MLIQDRTCIRDTKVSLIGARSKMISTPYNVNKMQKSYSTLRTSKVMYMNEKLVPMAMDFSRKVSQITRFKMKEEKFASENYQIMNYGIGGKIAMHIDSLGKKFS